MSKQSRIFEIESVIIRVAGIVFLVLLLLKLLIIEIKSLL
jgi:hypothetical protein